MQLSLRSYSQEVTLSFSRKNATLKEIVNEIERVSVYRFSSVSAELEAEFKSKDVSFKDATIRNVLDECLKGSRIDYSISGVTVTLKLKEVKVDMEGDTKMVSGSVLSMSGEPLPGVSVFIQGTSIGLTTNQMGYYNIRVPKDEKCTLVFSFVGMKTQYIDVESKTRIVNVKLEDEISEMDEVVVTGYQTIDKRYLTSAITTVKASDILVPGMTSIDQALEGNIPELLLMSNSGEVGATPRIRIRGTSTLEGNREPLWVLDGFILHDPVDVSTDDLNNPDYINIIGNAIAGINPQDIERIDVLKDASATALYGTQAANGVIVVTTKKGSIGSARISYNHSSKLTRRPRYTDRNIYLMNSQERVQFGKDLADLHYQFPSGMTMVGYEGALYRLYTGQTNYDEFLEEVKRYETVNTDWFDILTQDTYSHDHTLSVSGGSDNVRYYISLGYNYEDGVSKTTYGKRYTTRANLDLTFSEKIRASVSFSGNVQKKNNLMGEINAMDYAYNTTRALPCFNEDGSLFYYDKDGYGSLNTTNKFRYNILNEIYNSSNSYDGNTVNGSLNLKYDILKELSLTAAGSYNRSSTLQEQWWGEKTHYVAKLKNGEIEEAPRPSEEGNCLLPYGGVLKTSNSITESYTVRLQYDFRKMFGERRQMVASTGGFEVNSNTTRKIDDENRGFMKDRGLAFVDNVDLDLYPLYKNWLNQNHRVIGHGIDHQVSGYLTLSYSYGSHFTVYANGRFDFSNKFGSRANEKFLPIWAISGNWNLSQNILKNAKFISNVSLRTSFGTQGNMLHDQSPNLIIKQNAVDPLYNENVSEIARYPNPNLKWEQTRTFNLGLDMSFFKNRLNINGSFYSKRGKDMFTTVKVSPVNGLREYTMNGGKLKNDGYSVYLSATPIRTKDFQWRFSTQYSGNLNKVQSNAVDKYEFTDYLNGAALVSGEAIGTFYSYKFLGLNPQDGTPMFDDYADRQHLLQNKTMEETVLMAMSRSGKREPAFSGNFSNTFTYKGISLSMNLTYSLGSKVRLFPLYEPILSGVSSENNVRREFVDRWMVPGDETRTDIPVIMSPSDPDYVQHLAHFSTSPKDATQIQKFAESIWKMYDNSNIRVVSGNYLKCSSMSLRYYFDSKLLKRTPFSNLSVSLNSMNLFTISAKKLKGQDPSQAGFAKPNLSIRPSYTFQFNVTFK